ncbi:serine/arginine-rich splicing factor 7-like isoform X1 [Haliotis rufescens]|uniref:serine/arginine-rich splicing factor 7-like isoform X1 n=2 Tax=Haliotis rufescens TaxID=6454 RepID=UPI00201F4023|nr:serine/arginine-rich splicing factor 7-like isoform X1 [Haliotis rufescens]
MSVYDPACGGYRVFIGALGASTGKGHLIKDLQKYGKVLDLWLARNPPGYAYVVYSKGREAESLVRERNGRMLAGRRVRVEHARPYFSRSTTSTLPFHLIASRLRRKSKSRPRQKSRSPRNSQTRGHSTLRSPCKCKCERFRCSSSSSTSRTPPRTETQHSSRQNSPEKRRKRYKHQCGRKKRHQSRSRSSSSSSPSSRSRSRSRIHSTSSSSSRSSSRSRSTSRHRSKRSDTDVSVKYFKCRGRRRHKSPVSPVTAIADKYTGIESWTTDEDLPNLELFEAPLGTKDSAASDITNTENKMSRHGPEPVPSAVMSSTSTDIKNCMTRADSSLQRQIVTETTYQCHIQRATQNILDKQNEQLLNGSSQNDTVLRVPVLNTNSSSATPTNISMETSTPYVKSASAAKSPKHTNVEGPSFHLYRGGVP